MDYPIQYYHLMLHMLHSAQPQTVATPLSKVEESHLPTYLQLVYPYPEVDLDNTIGQEPNMMRFICRTLIWKGLKKRHNNLLCYKH